MAELTTQALPLLPLPAGVVLPQSVVTLVLETDEAQAAVATALDADRELLLVPRIDGRFARVGTVARVEDSGDLPNGMSRRGAPRPAPSGAGRGRHRQRVGPVGRGRARARRRADRAGGGAGP